MRAFWQGLWTRVWGTLGGLSSARRTVRGLVFSKICPTTAIVRWDISICSRWTDRVAGKRNVCGFGHERASLGNHRNGAIWIFILVDLVFVEIFVFHWDFVIAFLIWICWIETISIYRSVQPAGCGVVGWWVRRSPQTRSVHQCAVLPRLDQRGHQDFVVQGRRKAKHTKELNIVVWQ